MQSFVTLASECSYFTVNDKNDHFNTSIITETPFKFDFNLRKNDDVASSKHFSIVLLQLALPSSCKNQEDCCDLQPSFSGTVLCFINFETVIKRY